MKEGNDFSLLFLVGETLCTYPLNVRWLISRGEQILGSGECGEICRNQQLVSVFVFKRGSELLYESGGSKCSSERTGKLKVAEVANRR